MPLAGTLPAAPPAAPLDALATALKLAAPAALERTW